MDINSFRKLCKNNFGYLQSQYGFKPPTFEANAYGCFATYENKTTAIKISVEPREGGVFVSFSRLIEGKIPDYPIFIEKETKINTFGLQDLIQLNNSQSCNIKNLSSSFNDEIFYKNVLECYAKAVAEFASEILRGDFQSFVELEKMVKNRALNNKLY